MVSTTTLEEGHTYYMPADVIIPIGDTLLIQDSVTVIVTGASTAQTGTPEFQVNGCLICDGTKDQPIYLTVPAALRQNQYLTTGLWGGIAGTLTSGDIILKWTHIEYAGGTASYTDPIYGPGGDRYAVWFENPNANFVMEDCWVHGSSDDGLRLTSGRVSVMRNTFEANGFQSGQAINANSGAVGDIAYNLCTGAAGCGVKVWHTQASQTNVNVYNNTLVNCGWRDVIASHSGSIDIEQGARGKFYNNLIVNCRTGFRLLPSADTNNIFYDNQYYYAQDSYIDSEIYQNGGIQTRQPHDIAGPVLANDPKFVKYNVTQFDFSTAALSYPARITNQPVAMNEQSTSDFHLTSGSPAIGIGSTTFAPLGAITDIGGLWGATITPPGVDIGCYQTNGSGNQH